MAKNSAIIKQIAKWRDMVDGLESSPKIEKKSRFPRFTKIAGVVVALTLIVFLGIEFIPGFFNSNKSHQSATSNGNPQTTDSASENSQPVEYTVRSASLLSLDTAIESTNFDIYCHKADIDKAKELLTISEKDYLPLAKLFSKTPKTEILLTYDTDEYINVFTAAPPWGAESYKDPNTSTGAFCPGCTKSLGANTEYIYMLRPQNKSFAHELAHRYYWASYPNLPKIDSLTWLNEGQAVYIQTEVAPGPGGLSSEVTKINNSPLPVSFTELDQLQQKGDNISLERFYDLVGLLAYYIDGKADDSLKSFLTDLNTTQDLDKTCQNKLGVNSAQLLTNWKDAVSKTSGSDASDFLTNYKTLIKS